MKQVIVIRKDLNMRKGKMVAQGAHASLYSFLKSPKERQDKYLSGMGTKICVYVNSEEELIDIFKKAGEAGLTTVLIKDAGLTEFKEPTHTAVGIGPDEEDLINTITGTLKLL